MEKTCATCDWWTEHVYAHGFCQKQQVRNYEAASTAQCPWTAHSSHCEEWAAGVVQRDEAAPATPGT